jgi:hypothetical protein
MNEAIQQLAALTREAHNLGHPMMGGMPEEVQEAVRAVVPDMVSHIMDVASNLPGIGKLPEGQIMYVATLLSIMMMFGYGTEYVELHAAKASDKDEIEALLQEILGMDPDDNSDVN